MLATGLLADVLAASPAADAAFAAFWQAANPSDAQKAADAIAKSGVTFDEALARLKAGRTYSATAPKGIVRLSNRIGSTDFPYIVEVPETYTPDRKYQVRVQLHGGVGRPDASQRGNGIGALAGVEQIYVLPTAWAEAEWWTDRQLENIRAILDHVKRSYNVDENRVVLSGVSDGATAAYYVAMREVTPFASFLPLNGAIAVLRSSNVTLDGELYPNNYLNKPFFIVNGGRDPLYPTSLVEPYIEHMRKNGVTLTYLPQAEGVHNTSWWPEVKGVYEAFVTAHPRNPLPDTLTWESDGTATANRVDWLVIDRLAAPKVERAPLHDLNDFGSESELNFGIRAAGTRVTSVLAGSNAASFGVLPDDIISRINAQVIPPGVPVLDLLSIHDKGEAMTIVVTRGGNQVELKGTYDPTAMVRTVPIFGHTKPSGRVDLRKDGNTVTATTRRVSEFTLLLSPAAFDFSKPITVVADGKTVFDGRVAPSVATLAKWAAHDNDRTMLFGAELKIKLPE